MDKRAVYVIFCAGIGATKVGVAKNPEKRLATLQSGNPYPLEIKHTRWVGQRKAVRVEREVLRKFSADRLSGEWLMGYWEPVRDFVRDFDLRDVAGVALRSLPTNPNEDALERAVECFEDGRQGLAESLGVTAMSICHWFQRGVPITRAIEVERVTGGQVTREQLRPDIFGDKPDSHAAA